MTPAIAVYHLQRYWKKLVLFDQDFKVVFEEVQMFEDISDSDGFPCEDLHKITNWILQSWERLEADTRFDVKAVNFTSYGPALVHLNQNGEPIAPLFDSRKKIPEDLEARFFKTYGSQDKMALETYSPYLHMGNAGIQLYWLKHAHPTLFQKIKNTLFLPQYCSFLFTTNFLTEHTNLGGYTMLWDYKNRRYDQWAYEEGFVEIFPKIATNEEAGLTPFRHHFIPVGTGILDTVAGLIPFAKRNIDPFLLLSTGSSFTVLNPFATKDLSLDDLKKDCLCYLAFDGSMVKASRLMLGLWHEQYTKKFASHFFRESSFYKSVNYDPVLAANIHSLPTLLDDYYNTKPDFKAASLDEFASYELAYHKLISDIIRIQLQAIFLAGENLVTIKKMYVEGIFAENTLFMKMLTDSLPQLKIKSSDLNEGPALGAALAVKNIAGFN
jgi:sugar (pentulose or hexulose) kinase